MSRFETAEAFFDASETGQGLGRLRDLLHA